MAQSNDSPKQTLKDLESTVRREFETNRRILSFDEFLAMVVEQPKRLLRGSATYMLDMMDHFGRTPDTEIGLDRFKLFDYEEEGFARRVVGHEGVQNQIYSALKTFSRQGSNNKLLLLHGPNGSAKSSISQSLMSGVERYSKTQEGALYTFSWIFPHEKIGKGSIGFQGGAPASGRYDGLSSYARLPDEEIAARIPCDMKDHPLLLIPVEERKEFLTKLIGSEKIKDVWSHLPHIMTRGDLSHRNKLIFDALLTTYGGDIKRVLMHIQVERLYLSRRYRKGLVTIEPQMHVDASYQQLTMNKSLSHLPASLQSLNLFALSGDLVEGNRGMVEFSDLLKRPVDTFKYLLVACETGSVNVGNSIAYLDTVFIGSTNELQLDAFKEFPDFMSFKARIELIRVPYILRTHQEREIYEPELAKVAQDKAVAPHAAWTLAQWSVLTRLKKPNSVNFPPSLSQVIANLTPLEKARLYDNGEMPESLSSDDRKHLRASIQKLREEYQNIPYYEGRMGASPREMKTILHNAAHNPEFPTLSPLAVMREMEEFVKRISEYDFLKQDVKDGYHDAQEFITVVRNEYLNRIDHEVRDCMGLYDRTQWEDFLKKYVTHVSLILRKEKIKNPMTGKLEDPDMALIEEFEKIITAPKGDQLDSFRHNIITQVGAWKLDHPTSNVVYAQVFPEYWKKLEKHYYESQKALLTKMHNAVLLYGRDDANITEEGSRLARDTIDNLKRKLGYTEESAREVIQFLMRSRYS